MPIENSDTIGLLKTAFDEERKNRIIKEPEKRGGRTFSFINSDSFVYSGDLPDGVAEVGRHPAGFAWQGDPYVLFDEPLDMDLMEESVYDAFGRRIKIDTGQHENNRLVKRKTFLSWLDGQYPLILTFKKQVQFPPDMGILTYFTETSYTGRAEDTPKVIDSVGRYLKRKRQIPESQTT